MIKRIVKAIIIRFRGPSKFYPKGMNSNVDQLSNLVEIGKGYISSPGSVVLAHDASTITHIGKSRVEKTIIGDDVFVGANAVILPGIKVGDGAIVGAGAIVTKDVPPYTVVVGNPARVICKVDDYIEKCKARNVLYNLPNEVLEKHGTGIRYTAEESQKMIDSIYSQFKNRHS